jgi:hypothetical protein
MVAELNLGIRYRGKFADTWYWFEFDSNMYEKVFISMDNQVWKNVATPTVYDHDEIYYFKALSKEKWQYRIGFEGYYYNQGNEIKKFGRAGKGSYLSVN